METFGFRLELVDKISDPAKRATAAIKTIETGAAKAQDALSRKFAASWEKIGFAAMRSQQKQGDAHVHDIERRYRASEKFAQKQKDAFANSWNRIGMAADRAKKKLHEAAERKAELAKEHSLMGGIKEGVGFDNLTKASFFGAALAEGLMKVGETLVEAAHKVVEIFTEGIGKAFEEGGKEEKLRLNFRLALGQKEGAESLEDVERFSKLTKFTPEQIAPVMLKLRKAGFGQQAARSIFATGADNEAAGGMGVSEYADFAKHVKTKGGFTKKMLTEVLGEVGDTIPAFYKDLGKQLHVSAKKAEKMAKDGAIDPQLVLNMLQKSVERRQGGKAGTGAIAESETFEARWAKLKDLPNQFFKRLVDAPAFKAASDALGQMLTKLDPDSEAGARIMASLGGMFQKLIGWVDQFVSSGGIESLVSGIESALGLMGDLLPDFGSMADTIADAADSMAQMVSGARIMAALASGDKEQVNVLALQALKREMDRGHRIASRAMDKSDREAAAAGIGYGPLASDLNSPLAAAPAPPLVAKQGGGGTTVHAPVTVHLHGVTDEEAAHKAGRAAGDGVLLSLERARHETGG